MKVAHTVMTCVALAVAVTAGALFTNDRATRTETPTSSLATTPAMPFTGPAPAWLEERGFNVAALEAGSALEAALRLNQAVYAACQAGEQPVDLADVFMNCTGFCGTFSWMLQELLDEVGIESRLVHLHNIPSQGNHTAVEARIDEDWVFLDPTFGTFFTSTGDINGEALELADVAHSDEPGSVARRVVQAVKSVRPAEETLSTLYSGTFDHPYMSTTNYRVAEKLSYGTSDVPVSLDIALDLVDGRAAIGVHDIAAPGVLETAEKQWLVQTNARLNDSDPINDVSFNTSFLDARFDVTVSLYGIEPGRLYRVTLELVPVGKAASLRVTATGKGARAAVTGPVELEGKPRSVALFLTSARDSAQLSIRPLAGRVRLFGVHVEPNDLSEASRNG